MSYFDKKEDVLDLKLTPYGRHLLSRGKLMPKYYSFLDDDIVYNIQQQSTASLDEEYNSEIKNRIIDETPSIKPQYTMLSVETELSDNEINLNIEKQEKDTYVNVYDTQYRPTSDMNTKFLQNILGSSKVGTSKSPSWDIEMYGSRIKPEISTNFTSSIPSTDLHSPSPSASVSHIPQLEIDVEWVIGIKTNDNGDYQQDLDKANYSPNLEPIRVYPDGTYLNILEDQILSLVLEKNGFIRKDSFDIQVFKYDKTDDGFSSTYRPLKFLNKVVEEVTNYEIKKDILFEQPYSTTLEVDESTVEYYFDLRVDKEIPEKDICQLLKKVDSTNKLVEQINFKCPDVDIEAPTSPELPGGEPCDDPAEQC